VIIVLCGIVIHVSIASIDEDGVGLIDPETVPDAQC
jgi:hypothetical protein